MIWSEILEKIVTSDIEIEYSSEEKALEELKSLDLRSIKINELEGISGISTEELVSYRPAISAIGPKMSYSGAKIVYNIKKIASYADETLSQICSSLNISNIHQEFIKSFRWVFSCAIRRHAWFHYLVERGCRLLAENRYEEYLAKIYERRKNEGKGNLEEALADAYSIIYVEDDLRNFPAYWRDLLNNGVIIGFKKMIRRIFSNRNRPPGYREARYFIMEFETLKEIENNPDKIKELPMYSILQRGGRSLNGVFRGLSWLFHELTTIEPVEFTNRRNPPSPPYSIKDFLLFLENFRRDDSLMLLLLLPPDEVTGETTD